MANKMGVKSKKRAESRRGTPDVANSGKDLGNYTGFAHSRISSHFQLRERAIQPRPMIPSRLSFPADSSSEYRRWRNTGFITSMRSEITRRTEKEAAFFRSMTA